MVGLAKEVTDVVVGMLRGPGALKEYVEGRSLERGVPAEMVDRVIGLQVGGDIADKNLPLRYPAFGVYCAGIKNLQKEKFRRFSGVLEMVVEARVSSERSERLQDELQGAVEGVTAKLEEWRGDWGDGLFYGGGYDVSFSAAKAGGRGFGQVAKVTFEVEVSRG